MTEKQIERVKNKISKIKKGLAADKKHWGGYYHDGRGLRYLPPELYIKIQDYSGCLRYFNWFNKNFPEDSCYPIFLFEWAITLFKTKRIKLAENKIKHTFYSNTYLLDKFLDKELLHFDKSEDSNWEYEQLIEHFKYSKDQEELNDFTEWLQLFMKNENFLEFANEIIELKDKIKNEPIGEIHSDLVKKQYRLLEQIS
ncbi:hypothetical protein SAMN05444411_1421 [Lutibacter oricola]|uniref:Uncharacterized protein n=1 Tax=Lutibacter oricola TaxID=762486 RepID=A0A1H3HJ55_9FLAO|nr:hypothetical protein [Lutibacter oricola]SDY15380.1 hypothetical protein SAMN05444411_1421 [Lutibacter oricola]